MLARSSSVSARTLNIERLRPLDWRPPSRRRREDGRLPIRSRHLAPLKRADPAPLVENLLRIGGVGTPPLSPNIL